MKIYSYFRVGPRSLLVVAMFASAVRLHLPIPSHRTVLFLAFLLQIFHLFSEEPAVSLFHLLYLNLLTTIAFLTVALFVIPQEEFPQWTRLVSLASNPPEHLIGSLTSSHHICSSLSFFSGLILLISLLLVG